MTPLLESSPLLRYDSPPPSESLFWNVIPQRVNILCYYEASICKAQRNVSMLKGQCDSRWLIFNIVWNYNVSAVYKSELWCWFFQCSTWMECLIYQMKATFYQLSKPSGSFHIWIVDMLTVFTRLWLVV